jgi:biopolymer transport protein ExbB/TolQ
LTHDSETHSGTGFNASAAEKEILMSLHAPSGRGMMPPATGFSPADTPPLEWHALDPEQRMFFVGGRFTRVNTWCSALTGTLAAVAFYAMLLPFRKEYLAETFLDRGPIPYLIVWLTGWCLAILFLKWRKLALQARSLEIVVLPESHDFVLSPQTVDDVLLRVHKRMDDPRRFVLFHRIVTTLSNLRNLGRVNDVDELLRNQAADDADALETSYSLAAGFIWAVPVLGFIGTVQGLSVAVGGFGAVLSTSSELSAVKGALRDVTGGLAVAFETTMQGLVAALVLQLVATALKKSEYEFLETCGDYCSTHIVGRLRLAPYDRESV